jgi:hypothetical protein
MAIYTSNHIGKWHWLKYDGYVVLAQEFSSQVQRDIQPKKLIMGDGGTHVMGFNGIENTVNISSEILLRNSFRDTFKYSNVNDGKLHISEAPMQSTYLYRDPFDLLITDFDKVKAFIFLFNPYNNLTYPAGLSSRNLLTSAAINISNNVRCNLNYNCLYNQFVTIQYADYFPPNYDFIARTAKNYDCKFFVTDDPTTTYKVLSADININVNYSKIYILNQESEYPLYGPNGYEVSGSIKTPAKNWYDLQYIFDNTNAPKTTNFSLLVGNRYLRLGQVLVEDKIEFSMSEGLMTATISFKGYARL